MNTSKAKIQDPLVDVDDIHPRPEQLLETFNEKYGTGENLGWSPALRLRQGYFSADDFYEHLMSRLVSDNCNWIDVGCGRDIFPSNYKLAKKLADRAEHLLGIDPDDNIHQNDLLTERHQGFIENCTTPLKFDVISLRMVAEHIEDADGAVRKIAELCNDGAVVVIYTPWKYAPMSLAASLVPFRFHNRLKRLIWDTEPEDTFPTQYKMNTRTDLATLFSKYGFAESYFSRVDDCSVFTRFRVLNRVEIAIRNLFLRLHIPYPEHCLLGCYRKTSD